MGAPPRGGGGGNGALIHGDWNADYPSTPFCHGNHAELANADPTTHWEVVLACNNNH